MADRLIVVAVGLGKFSWNYYHKLYRMESGLEMPVTEEQEDDLWEMFEGDMVNVVEYVGRKSFTVHSGSGNYFKNSAKQPLKEKSLTLNQK